MGYIAHKAVIVTCFRKEDIERIRIEAIRLMGPELLSDNVESEMNGYITFFIAPDGSKEGWDKSEQFDRRVNQFCDWMDGIGDNEPFADYALVCYGGDDPEINNRIARPKYPQP